MFVARNWAKRPAQLRGRLRPVLASALSAFFLINDSLEAFAACLKVRQGMFQIIFNELSAAEMSALPKKMQLNLLEQFEILPEDLDRLDAKHFGVIEREGKKLYRYRAKDYRIYFAKTQEGIKIYRVLHKNTFRDFLFRSKLPVSEDQALGKTREFWKLIEQGEKTRKT